MAFTQKTFTPISSQSNSDSINGWMYRTDDDEATIEAAGYFNKKLHQINDGDAVLGQTSEGPFIGAFSNDGETIQLTIRPQVSGVDYLPLTGGTVTGQIKGITPVAAEDLTRKDYVDSLAGGGDFLPLAGGTVTGQIKGITPVDAEDLVRKDYADSLAGGGGSSGSNFGRKNDVVNGDFGIWQRNITGIDANLELGADRFFANKAGTASYATSQATFTVGQTDVPGGPKYYMSNIVNGVAAGASLIHLTHKIRDVARSSGMTKTASIWVKCSVNAFISLELIQNFGSGGSTTVTGIDPAKLAVTTSWTKVETTMVIPSVSGKTIGAGNHLGLVIWFDGGANTNSRHASLGNQSGTFDIALVQLENGDTATDFEATVLDRELELCQREYRHSYVWEVLPGTATQLGAIYEPEIRNSGTIVPGAKFPAMAEIPTIELWSSNSVKSQILNGTDGNRPHSTIFDMSDTGFSSVLMPGGNLNQNAFYHYTAATGF